jgi:hypothetical protein
LFSIKPNFFARTQKKQRDWLATNTDDIPSQSHYALVRAEKNAKWKTGFNELTNN